MVYQMVDIKCPKCGQMWGFRMTICAKLEGEATVEDQESSENR